MRSIRGGANPSLSEDERGEEGEGKRSRTLGGPWPGRRGRRIPGGRRTCDVCVCGVVVGEWRPGGGTATEINSKPFCFRKGWTKYFEVKGLRFLSSVVGRCLLVRCLSTFVHSKQEQNGRTLKTTFGSTVRRPENLVRCAGFPGLASNRSGVENTRKTSSAPPFRVTLGILQRSTTLLFMFPF